MRFLTYLLLWDMMIWTYLLSQHLQYIFNFRKEEQGWLKYNILEWTNKVQQGIIINQARVIRVFLEISSERRQSGNINISGVINALLSYHILCS